MDLNGLNNLDPEELLYNIIFSADEDDVTAQLIIFDEEGNQIVEIYHVLLVSEYSSSISNENDIEIYNEHQSLMGLLCLSNEDSTFVISDLTPARYISYLVDRSSALGVSTSESYVFRKSYLLIFDGFISEYKEKYQTLSPHWGKFTHNSYEKVTVDYPNEVIANSKLIMPTEEHVDKFQRSILSSDGFDRFLKKYHVLELIYDYVCVLKFRTMNTDLNGFSQLIKDTSKGTELKRLDDMVKSYVTDVQEIVLAFEDSKEYESVIVSLCQDVEKDGNPLSDPRCWDIFWGFVEAGDIRFKADKVASGVGKFAKYKDSSEYNSILLKISTFWIYRIRCSIAHMKIGEFIFKGSDEEFVVKVGERMVDSLIENIYSNQSFKELVNKSDRLNDLLESL